MLWLPGDEASEPGPVWCQFPDDLAPGVKEAVMIREELAREQRIFTRMSWFWLAATVAGWACLILALWDAGQDNPGRAALWAFCGGLLSGWLAGALRHRGSPGAAPARSREERDR